MIDDSVRRLIARIAKGMPIVIAGAAAPFVLAGCVGTDSGCNGFDSQPEVVVVSATPAAIDAGFGDGGLPDAGPRSCWEICQSAPENPSNGKSVTNCEEVDEGIECTFAYVCRGGRRPERAYAQHCDPRSLSPRQAWFVALATAELASVPAFEELSTALARLGAPTELVERARTSARDEVKHAQMAFALAEREGPVQPIRIDTASSTGSTLLEVAAHNAAEGCVREAYAALEAAWQAEHATDEETRSAFAEIARDEARHAALSLDIDRWARTALGPSAEATLDEARRRAISELDAELTQQERPDGLGLPGATPARAMLAMIA